MTLSVVLQDCYWFLRFQVLRFPKRQLQDSSHACVMLTGDAPLTALSVAVEVAGGSLDPDDLCTSSKEIALDWV